jgi:hypothetical protein
MGALLVMLEQNNSVPSAHVPDPQRNKILATLFQSGRQDWEPHLEPCELTPGQVLYEPGHQPEYLYFPTTALVSLLFPTASGSPAEIATIGDHGIVGIGLLLGGVVVTPSRAVVRSGGMGFRLRAQMMRDELNRATPVMDVMLHYAQTLIRQMVQNVGHLPATS